MKFVQMAIADRKVLKMQNQQARAVKPFGPTALRV